jgi:hypothetical protein
MPRIIISPKESLPNWVHWVRLVRQPSASNGRYAKRLVGANPNAAILFCEQISPISTVMICLGRFLLNSARYRNFSPTVAKYRALVVRTVVTIQDVCGMVPVRSPKMVMCERSYLCKKCQNDQDHDHISYLYFILYRLSWTTTTTNNNPVCSMLLQ